MASVANALPTVGIISMGDMGSGIARLLVAHRYPVVTNVSDRSCVAPLTLIAICYGLLPV
jgi:3-hydroxyacyl-CoA dehydrogenase